MPNQITPIVLRISEVASPESFASQLPVPDFAPSSNQAVLTGSPSKAVEDARGPVLCNDDHHGLQSRFAQLDLRSGAIELVSRSKPRKLERKMADVITCRYLLSESAGICSAGAIVSVPRCSDVTASRQCPPQLVDRHFCLQQQRVNDTFTAPEPSPDGVINTQLAGKWVCCRSCIDQHGLGGSVCGYDQSRTTDGAKSVVVDQFLRSVNHASGNIEPISIVGVQGGPVDWNLS